MRSKFSKRVLSAVVAASMSLSLFSFEAFAQIGKLNIDDTPPVKMNEEYKEVGASAYSLNMHSKKEIQKKFFELGMNSSGSTTYSQAYSLTAPYSAGELTSGTLQQALNTVNFVRYVAGLDSVTLNDNYNNLAQHASLVNAVNGSLSHSPSQPSGMSDEMYQLGLTGASSSNLGWGYTSIPDSIIRGYMEDTDSSNIDRVGHRRWILYPAMQQIGFGMVSNFTATYVFDNVFGGYLTDDYIAWPPRYMPYEIYKPSSMGYAFSVNLGNDYDTPSLDNVTVEVSSKLQNKTWKLDKSSTDKSSSYLNVENSNYGMAKCIIFKVGSFDNYDEVTVKINGIYKDGVSSPITYTVNFFSVNDTIEDETVDAPEKVTATPGIGKVTLSWSKVTGADKYRIQRCVNGSSSWSTIAYPTATSYTDTSVTNGTTYKYRILAYAGSTMSEPSNVVTATPVASVGTATLSGTAGIGKVTLSWTKVTGATKYRIQRYDAGSGVWSTVANSTGTSYIDTSVTNGTTYKYRVYAYVGTTIGGSSNIVTATPVGTVGTATLSGTAGNGQVALSWTSVTGATKYRLQRYDAVSGVWATVANTTAASYNDTSVTNGTAYKYRVYAYVGTTIGGSSNVVTATPVGTVGTATLSGTAGNGKVTLSWTSVTGATKYRLQRYDAASGIWATVATTTSRSYTDTSVTNGTAYKYRVYAYVGTTIGGSSNIVTATPVGTVGTATLSGTAGNGQVALSWTSVTGATKYRLQRYDAVSGVWATVANTTSRSYTDTSVNIGTTYMYRVFAYVGTTIGSSSNVVTITAS